MRTPSSSVPVKIRDAASLILVDMSGEEPGVLMGRRHQKMRFMPDAFVFPGGKPEPEDQRLEAPDFTPVTRAEVAHASCSPEKARVLALAAIRETREETGLFVSIPGDVGQQAAGTWLEFRTANKVPALNKLRFVGRAITPRGSPVRFHARFFLAQASACSGTIRTSGELLDIDWYPLSKALNLPAIDVTQFMLGEMANHISGKFRGSPPLYCYRNNIPMVIHRR